LPTKVSFTCAEAVGGSRAFQGQQLDRARKCHSERIHRESKERRREGWFEKKWSSIHGSSSPSLPVNLIRSGAVLASG
jgi:hypothetical protein